MTKKIVSKEVVDIKPKAPSIFGKVIDGFTNLVSRLGAGQGVDNALSESTYTFNLISRNRVMLEAMYRGSWIVGAGIDSVAEDMTRAGITITSTDSPKDIEELNKAMNDLQIMNTVQDVIKWSRLYGGAIGVMMIDGQDLESPLNIKRVQKGQFSGISVFDRWQLWPDLANVIRNGPDIGLPAYYTLIGAPDIINAMNGDDKGTFDLSAAAQSGGLRVHHSRIIRLTGVKLPYYQSITEMMWGMSEVERVYDRLVSFDGATMSSANLINHANLRTVKIKDLREIVSSGSKAAVDGLMAQFDMMRFAQSNEGLTLLDAEDEFASTSYSFAGLSDMMLQFGQQLSGAWQIPLVRLFGQSPAGLNSTGESDLRMYYDKINAQQNKDLRRPFTQLLKVIYQSTFGRPAPSDLTFTFTPLWQMSATEKANNGRTIAETIAGAHESQLISKFTALKELRQASPETGLFSNITDEDISEAEKEKDEGPPMPDDVPEVDLEKGDKEKSGGASNETISEVSLNGAQVTAMLTLVNQVSQNQIPRETAVKMMTTAFPIDEKTASAILGKVGKGFKPESEPEVKK